jgi:hypothetical protein
MQKKKTRAQIGLVAALVLLVACMAILFVQDQATNTQNDQPRSVAVSTAVNPR